VRNLKKTPKGVKNPDGTLHTCEGNLGGVEREEKSIPVETRQHDRFGKSFSGYRKPGGMAEKWPRYIKKTKRGGSRTLHFHEDGVAGMSNGEHKWGGECNKNENRGEL